MAASTFKDGSTTRDAQKTCVNILNISKKARCTLFQRVREAETDAMYDSDIWSGIRFSTLKY